MPPHVHTNMGGWQRTATCDERRRRRRVGGPAARAVLAGASESQAARLAAPAGRPRATRQSPPRRCER